MMKMHKDTLRNGFEMNIAWTETCYIYWTFHFTGLCIERFYYIELEEGEFSFRSIQALQRLKTESGYRAMEDAKSLKKLM